ncbi:uncharacterized protein LAESUDRAFT_72282 [Laetiporus sulphureus 93-53]|uniref:Uncharacterized protein n=1 Tax=Laetiporus sulphureus 93-53 TaxID=1314785 RepID=A0A165AVI7_9APHY|nr:uncharacterized protein LAESUDRAFT_72282 [Laetiporus sulphureus 93-53]KZS99746.1 hypothetical protein LAESUDRAFT_72282 [Laetiporus sulphureus 93-53]
MITAASSVPPVERCRTAHPERHLSLWKAFHHPGDRICAPPPLGRVRGIDEPEVQEKYGASKWAGMIVLSCPLLIFLIEYIANSYVYRLQSYSSARPSPCSMPSLSSASSPTSSPAQIPEPSIGTPDLMKGREEHEGGASHLAGDASARG